MRLEARGQQRLEQKLLPQMLQAVEVLQLATADLLHLVDQELESNETLELASSAEKDPSPDAGDTKATDQLADRPSAAGEDAGDALRAMLERQPAPVDSLLESVRMQVAFRGLDEPLAGAIVRLAEFLDERGLLPVSLQDVAVVTSLNADLLEAAHRELRQFEPRGIGATTAVEAMLLQAAGDPDVRIMECILTRHLEALARNKLPQVAKDLGMGVEQLEAILERMRGLQPAPGAGFFEAAEPAIKPDAHAWMEGEDVRVVLADALPALMVNSTYEALLLDRTQDKPLRDYLRSKVRAARDLISAISMRQQTLLRVVEAVMRRQRGFLLEGRVGLRPLRMTELGEELGLHASTISRAIAGKHVSTALGTVALREFFDGARDSGSGGKHKHARGAVAQHISDLVAAEDRCNPLSDEGLVEKLREMGIRTARRTVTKFRRELGLPASYQRRRYGASGK